MEYFIPLKTSVESPEPCICKISWMTTGTNESPIWGHESGSGRQVKMWLVHRSLKRRLTLPSISRPCDFRAAYKKGFWGITLSLPRSESSRDLLKSEKQGRKERNEHHWRGRGGPSSLSTRKIIRIQKYFSDYTPEINISSVVNHHHHHQPVIQTGDGRWSQVRTRGCSRRSESGSQGAD